MGAGEYGLNKGSKFPSFTVEKGGGDVKINDESMINVFRVGKTPI